MAREIMKASPLARLERKFAAQYRNIAQTETDEPGSAIILSEQEYISRLAARPLSQQVRVIGSTGFPRSVSTRSEADKPDIPSSLTESHARNTKEPLQIRAVTALHPPCPIQKPKKQPVRSQSASTHKSTAKPPVKTTSNTPIQPRTTRPTQRQHLDHFKTLSSSLDDVLTKLDSDIDNFISELASFSSSSSTARTGRSPLALPQRLWTMDLDETMECLRGQGYSRTFIAEHLRARGYRVASSGEIVYRERREERIEITQMYREKRSGKGGR